MHSALIIIDSFDKWAPYYRTESVITAHQYLQDETLSNTHYLVINLCSDLSYNSDGYYCSLLAQARNHRVIPSVETLNGLEASSLQVFGGLLERYCRCLEPASGRNQLSGNQLDIFFGKCAQPKFEKLARHCFDRFPAPLLRVNLSPDLPSQIVGLRPLSLDELDEKGQDVFANALDQFCAKVWRQPRSKKPARYDLAILHDPEDPLGPSNKGALKCFISEAKKMNVNAELITAKDSARLMEFDALFIRQTTAVNHVTYQMAQAAQKADMVVIDDPTSIIRCTNKVYLKELMDSHSILAPQSRLLYRSNPRSYEEISERLGQKMVIKIPDGSFSKGVSLVSSAAEYDNLVESLFTRSAILLAQEFVPTEFDWRIGVLNGECIYACKYFMASGHWQIYNHQGSGGSRTGRFETVPTHQVPRQVTKTATRVASAIGKGLYGVDLKVTAAGVLVIEVNDNPSLDHGIEDKILGNELYRMILREFVNRLEFKRHH